MKKSEINMAQVHELLYQSLETEMGGIKIYESAIHSAVNPGLKKEWQKYLDETRHHEEVLLEVFSKLGLDPSAKTPGREVVAHLGKALVGAMEKARAAGDPKAAELVACECVVLAETKDHGNWELIGLIGAKGKGTEGKALLSAFEEVEDDEDQHLYHTAGWARELWVASLGLPAVLPPPEEIKKVETAIGAARAAQAREEMV